MDTPKTTFPETPTTEGPPPEGPAYPRPTGARKMPSNDRTSQARHGYVRGFDGTKLFYSVEGSGPPLVFCYGLVCSSLHWTYQIDYFKRNYQTIWFDYRGHQNSEMPKNLSSITIENIARDLAIVLDELGLRGGSDSGPSKQPVLLGHSMGVNIVLDFYRQYPQRVKALVLANGTPKRPLETAAKLNSFDLLFKALRKTHGLSPRLFQEVWNRMRGNPIARTVVSFGGFNPHLTPKEDIELYIDQVLDMKPEILLQLIENYNQYDATPWLHTIRKPTLIIAGEQDSITPISQQELMNQLIPGSHMERIRHGSHCSQMDLPDLINLKIETFLKNLSLESTSSPTTGSANQSNSRSNSDKTEAKKKKPRLKEAQA